MLTIAIKKLILLVKFVLSVLVILLLLPTLARASCSPPAVAVTVQESEISMMVDGLRRLGEYECASYHGTVFLEEKLPVELLGVHVSDITILQAAEGTVIASVDLTGLDPEDIQGAGNRVSISLPEPVVACHRIIPQWSIYPRSLPIGSADDIAVLENSMAEEARSILLQQALENGILEEAEFTLKRQATEIARQSGYEGEIILEFHSSETTGESPADNRAQSQLPTHRSEFQGSRNET